MLKLSGYDYDEIIGKSPRMFQNDKTSKETRKIIKDKMIDYEEVNCEILNVDKSGNEYWIDLNIVPLYGENNEHNGFVAVQNDITNRKKFEKEILDINNRLESILN